MTTLLILDLRSSAIFTPFMSLLCSKLGVFFLPSLLVSQVCSLRSGEPFFDVILRMILPIVYNFPPVSDFSRLHRFQIPFLLLKCEMSCLMDAQRPMTWRSDHPCQLDAVMLQFPCTSFLFRCKELFFPIANKQAWWIMLSFGLLIATVTGNTAFYCTEQTQITMAHYFPLL